MKPELLEEAKKIHEIFRNNGLTLSVAESCTGGLISNVFTDMPGASKFFSSGIIAYSKEAKENILGISHDIINSSGVVSRDTAQEMSEKVRLLSGTDYSISTTGNLGPEVLEEKGRGLIYIAAGKEGRTVSRELRLKGDREENKEEAAFEALKLLMELVKGKV